MNILILAAGQTDFDAHDGAYPTCLTEIDGVPVIERVVSNCSFSSDRLFTFAFRKEDVERHHMDNVVALLAPNSNVLQVQSGIKGAACTALLAVKWIDNEEELLIASSNELLNVDLATVVNTFHNKQVDAGVITFPSIHPRYSYVRLDENGLAAETAEKNPISRHAMTGVYWFAHGRDFIRAAQNMIRKDANVNGLFYIAVSLNDLILENLKVGIYSIEANQYFPLKTERQLDHIEQTFVQGKSS
jgi:bifunctional N-acetylglucosamine-1-phosphate-uridyltransferase/glucosamine-1-phosphate-acetyltransferase GlmU-like protein